MTMPPPNVGNTDPDEQLISQPLIDHLLDLRKRLLWSFLGLTLAMIVAYVYVEPIYGFLVRPLALAMGDHGTQRLIYTDLTEAFFTYVKVAFFAGLFVSFPLILSQIWMFIAPGLYARERKAFIGFFVATPLLFYLGGAVVYFVILPIAWTFFLSFQSSGAETVLPIQLEARVGEYLNLVMVLVLAFGLSFELPIFLLLLARTGVITSAMLRKRRKYAIIIVFIIAAVLTPPDVVSQTCLAIPLLALYEISILLIDRLGKTPDEEGAEVPVSTDAPPAP